MTLFIRFMTLPPSPNLSGTGFYFAANHRGVHPCRPYLPAYGSVYPPRFVRAHPAPWGGKCASD